VSYSRVFCDEVGLKGMNSSYTGSGELCVVLVVIYPLN